MPLHQNRIRIRIPLHRLLQTLSQILLMRRILNDRYPQAIKVSQIPRFTPSFRYPFYLLDFLDFEARVGTKVALDEKGDKHGPLRVRVDAAAGAAVEGGEEEGGAGGGFEDLGSCV
jgi:hypothetical protein